jgi:hypothetical protein
LLGLFPLKTLKSRWPKAKGSKDAISGNLSNKQNTDEIVAFVDEYLACCKQHVYVFSRDRKIEKPPKIGSPEGEKALETGEDKVRSALYLFWCEYTVVLGDPMERRKIKFLWPVRLELAKETVIFRFVVLEKNIASHFEGRTYYTAQKAIDEETVLEAFFDAWGGPLNSTDLNKGIKELWKTGNIDCTRTQYKRPLSTVTETMDEARGIRQYNKELYETLATSPLFNSQFVVTSKEFSTVSAFSIDPSKGRVAFPRYTEESGDTDHVIREILKHNQ